MGVLKTFQKTPQREQEPEQPKVFHFTPTSHEIPGKTFILETKREPNPPPLILHVELTEREALGPLTITVPITEPEPEPPRLLKVTLREN